MRERDRNQQLHIARSRRPPLSTTMQTDKQSANTTTSKPLTPALSSNFRSLKSPLTPRVAGSPSPSPLATVKQPFVRTKSPAKPEQTTTPLRGNITPRSTARKSRADTESPLSQTQPNVLNNGQRSRASSGEAQKSSTVPAQGLGITSPRLAASTPTLVKAGASSSGPVVTVHRRISAAKSLVEGHEDISWRLFHASEVKSAIGSPGIEENQRFPPKPGRFFVGSPPLPPATDNVDPRSTPEEKFFRANDIHLTSQPKCPLPHFGTERLESTNVEPPKTPPASPKKSHNPLLSPRKYRAGQTPSPPTARTTAERPTSTSSAVSITQFNVRGHRKSLSASSVSSLPTRTESGPPQQAPLPLDLRITPILSPRIVGGNLVSPVALSPRSISLVSSNTIPTSVTSETDLSEVSALVPGLPTSPLNYKLEQQTTPVKPQLDAATNARRERKVLDLEISNSSLLAINKTLERELRKQSTELRRFRRLSRSGRLSLAPTTRTVSEQTTFSLGTVTEMDDDSRLSDFDDRSDASDLDDDEEGASVFSGDSSSQGLTSPSVYSRQRARDEKRLMHDLSRHHQLLLDSQKLNQSIKRCLTCTEDMIKEGNKALEYRVGIGDVKIGGRVLNDDELDERGLVDGAEESQARQGLLSPSVAKANLDQAQLWADALPPQLAVDTQTGTTRESTGIASLDELSSLLDSVTAGLETADP